MAKKQIPEDTEVSTKTELSPEELKKRLEELEALIAQSDEEKLKRVCRAMNVDYSQIVAKEQTITGTMVEMDMGAHEVNVNGKIYRHKVTVPIEVARVLQQTIGDKRMRLLREMVGKDYLIEMLQDGTSHVRVIGQVNEYGEKVG